MGEGASGSRRRGARLAGVHLAGGYVYTWQARGCRLPNVGVALTEKHNESAWLDRLQGLSVTAPLDVAVFPNHRDLGKQVVGNAV